MSDRRDSYFLQLVDEAFFDECFDDLENADRLLAVDIGFTGITSGLVMTEHSAPPDLTVDLTAGVSYDQAGRRCEITSAVAAFNCAVDENAVSTAVAAPGNERWLSIQIRFDRTLTNPQVDGNGNTVYVDQDESYDLAVVMGVEQAAGTGLAGPAYTGRPALPTDGRLVGDVLLIFGQTAITTVGDIFTERRQDFSIYAASSIPVTSSGWSFLNPATDDVQAVFDFIDTYSLVTNSTTELLQDIVPSIAGRHLGKAAQEWDLYVLEMVTVAASRVDGNLLPKVSGNDLGASAGPLRWSLYADLIDLLGNLNLDGEIITSAGSRVNGNLLPKAGTEDLGSTILRWDAFINTATIYTKLAAAAGGEDLGDAANQFDAFLQSIQYHGAINGTFQFNSAKSITVRIPINKVLPRAGSSWVVVGGALRWETSSSGDAMDFFFEPLEDATITEMRIRWKTASGTSLAVQVVRADEDGTTGALGGNVPIGGGGATRWDTIFTGQSGGNYVVDKTLYTYRAGITCSAAVLSGIYALEVTYDITDILMAAMGQG